MVNHRSTYHSGSAYSLDWVTPIKITGSGQHDKQLVPPENETGEAGEGQPRPARALHDIVARRDQRVASESKNNSRRVKRPQTAESGDTHY